LKISPECVPCLLKRLLYETNLVDPSIAGSVMKEACGILNEDLSPDICSAELATTAHRRTYELLNKVDPYENIKKQAMDVGLMLEKKAKALVDQSSDRLRAAIKVSVVGNVLDFGIPGGARSPDELIARFDQLYNEQFGYDDIDRIRKYIKPGAKILFFTDNCGEIVFDKILCQVLKESGVQITLVVKGEPILSDATEKEAKQIHIDEMVDEILTTGHYAVGMKINSINPDLDTRLKDFDLIISKGMANFEALSETELSPIFYLLRTKCAPVAKALGLPKDLNVAKLFE
jgi:uncharacterized protein with ATP-grasp and redox domains